MKRVALITDLHIKPDGLAYGIDTEANFIKLINELSNWEIDHIICAGDLSAKEPSVKDCFLVKTALDQMQIPYSVIAGNHDRSVDIANVFGKEDRFRSKDDEVYFAEMIGERYYLFLDTNKGYISDRQLMWLQDKLNHCSNPPFVVMHYPPIPSGVIYIDANYQFQDSDRILSVLNSYNGLINIFCGHCHSERTIQYNNLMIHITPSSLEQVDERAKNYITYHDYVGYRIIEEENGAIRTFVKYLF